MEIIIKNASEHDIEQLDELEAISWDDFSAPEPPPINPFKNQRLKVENTLIAVNNGQVIGYASIGLRTPISTNKHVCKLRSIIVHPNFRRNGVALKIMKQILLFAKQRKFTKITLTVLSSNNAAIELYKSCDFQIEGRMKGEFIINDKYVDDLTFSRRLN